MDSICIIGLGYVGLPLAIEFAKKYQVIGFDVDQNRIDSLLRGHDQTLEVSNDELKNTSMKLTTKIEDIQNCNIYIVSVPTPIDQYKKPDLSPLLKASESVGSVLKKDDIVIYESTVYPGCTEEVCVHVLEKFSGLKFNEDFFCGYSPERINQGDKEKTLTKIVKITSGSNPLIAEKVNQLYLSIIEAGTFKASSIKVAEAAKVIENAQRDINIAFVNELSIIFNKLDLDTNEVLEAAATKWNFLKFYPGLVGGHCVGIDTYYLTHKIESLGYYPQVILAGRKINDGMGAYVANQVVKLMIKKGHHIQKSKVLILGLTFKENCTDIRNSKIFDTIKELEEFGCLIDLYDPLADAKEIKNEYHLDVKSKECLDHFLDYSAVILAVPHEQFFSLNINGLKQSKTVFYDLKGVFSQQRSDGRL